MLAILRNYVVCKDQPDCNVANITFYKIDPIADHSLCRGGSPSAVPSPSLSLYTALGRSLALSRNHIIIIIQTNDQKMMICNTDTH